MTTLGYPTPSPLVDLWVLGAPDPEMEEIEAMLLTSGQYIVYASPDGVRRVRPAESYYPDMTMVPGSGPEWLGAERVRVITVECSVPPGCDHVVEIDHHRPGDPGHNRPATEYAEASSLGQVAVFLGVALDARQRLIAAADHCLGAAYRGECPGVNPEELARWRAESRAGFQRRPVEEVLADVASAPELAGRTIPPDNASKGKHLTQAQL